MCSKTHHWPAVQIQINQSVPQKAIFADRKKFGKEEMKTLFLHEDQKRKISNSASASASLPLRPSQLPLRPSQLPLRPSMLSLRSSGASEGFSVASEVPMRPFEPPPFLTVIVPDYNQTNIRYNFKSRKSVTWSAVTSVSLVSRKLNLMLV